jgi:hypothetical protein
MRRLTPSSSLALLKQEARRWHGAIHAGAPDALARLHAAWPTAPRTPTLRQVQHALAREHGVADWRALRAALDDFALDRRDRADRIALVLRHGWDGDHALARRIIARAPELAQASLFTAAAAGDVAHVERCLARDPRAATARDPERGWPALAHVAYGRLDDTHAVTIATQLLDAGADVTFRWTDAWGNAFTLLTGVAGEGEAEAPPHPLADRLAALFLARGIDPFDPQLLYNTSLGADDPTWLERLWTAALAQGRTGEWRRTDGRPIGGHLALNALDYLLGNAAVRGHVHRAAWLLAHGARADAPHAYERHPVHTAARLAGQPQMVALLESHGATAERLHGPQALLDLLLTDDIDAARALVQQTPALARDGAAWFAAATHGRATVVTHLLALGADLHAVDHDGATALHRAAQAGSVATIDMLLAAGAAVDVRDQRWHGTPLSWAVVLGQDAAADRLAPVSRDARALARSARLERLEAVLRDAPALADAVLPGAEDPTPLFCLPDDADDAIDVVRLLMAHGADPSRRDAAGRTAIEAARLRGLDDAADAMAHPLNEP